MNIFIIIVLVIIVFQLFGVNDKLKSIDISTDKIRDMAEMSDQQRYEYSLKIDDHDRYSSCLVDKFYREEAKKKKQELQ